MISIFWFSLALGFVFNAAPGAIFAESLQRGMKHGFYEAFSVQVGSLVGDITWAVLGLSSLSILLANPMFQGPLSVVGGVYLVYLACQSWFDSSTVDIEPTIDTSKTLKGKGFRVGAALSLSNPQNIFFWSALGTSIASFSAQVGTAKALTIFFIGFATSSLAWCFICAYLVGVTLRNNFFAYFSVISKICAIALFALGLSSFYYGYDAFITDPIAVNL